MADTIIKSGKYFDIIDGNIVKACYKCQELKPLTDFHYGLHGYCKHCSSIYMKERRATSHGKALHRADARRATQRKLVITNKEYQSLLDTQNKLCAICKQPERTTRNGRQINLTLDHNHETGLVRGLLCSSCNKALGLFSDNIIILKAAISYLEHAERRLKYDTKNSTE